MEKARIYKKVAFFIDGGTHFRWAIAGKCIAGSMKGEHLNMIPHTNHFACESLSFFSDAKIYTGK